MRAPSGHLLAVATMDAGGASSKRCGARAKYWARTDKIERRVQQVAEIAEISNFRINPIRRNLAV
jgi:hypothetical protein